LKNRKIGNNAISGSFPSFILSLTSLTTLDLSSNDFTGNIPSDISNLSLLQTLDLHGNSFNSSIPSTLSNLILLDSLRLDENDLSGSIPTSFAALTLLTLCKVGEGNQLCHLDDQHFPNACTDLNSIPSCSLATPIATSHTNNDLPMSTLAIIIALSLAGLAFILLIIFIIHIIRKGRKNEFIKQDTVLDPSVPTPLDASQTSSSLAMVLTDFGKTVPNDTIIKLGPSFAMPGHLLRVLDEDVRIIDHITEGGGGAIKLAEMLSHSTILDNHIHKTEELRQEVVLKLMKNTENDRNEVDDNSKAVWQQEISIMW